MTDPRVPLKNPILALCLGLLFPGGGQLYQGRTFKGVLYAVCIVGTFTYGMFLSEWTALYAGSPLSSTNRRWGYLAQAPMGAPAMYALVQQRRYHSPDNVPQMGLNQSLSAEFEGIVRMGADESGQGMTWPEIVQALEEGARKALEEGRDIAIDTGVRDPEYQYFQLKGQIELRPETTMIGPVVQGRFVGHITVWNSESRTYEATGESLELKLSSEVGRFEIDREIYADRERSLKIPVVGESEQGRPTKVGVLRGTIPRPVGNWLAVPLESEKLSRLHFTLGKTFDLAMVYTWIAGLLNVLVLWDAFAGPAYGYGDEKPDEDPENPKGGEKKAGSDKPEKQPAAG